MKKRLISALLAAAVSVMQLMPSAAMIAFADNSAGSAPGGFRVSLGSASGKPGEEVTLELAVSGNPGVSGLAVQIEYDTETFECIDIVDKQRFGGADSFIPPADMGKSPFRVGWISLDDMYGDDGVLAELKFRVRENVYNGDYDISLSLRSDGEVVRMIPAEDPLAMPQIETVPVTLKGGVITVEDGLGKQEYSGEKPEPPEIMNITAYSFEVDIGEGQEYTYSDSPITDFSDSRWFTEKAVTDLMPNTEYFVYRRTAETKTMLASKPSEAASAVTARLTADEVVESVSIGTNGAAGTVLKPAISFKKGCDSSCLGTVTCLWNGTAETDPDILNASEYAVTEKDVKKHKEISVTLAFSDCTGTVTSNTVAAGKAEFSGTEASPAVKDITKDGFTVAAMMGYEYVVSDTPFVPAAAVWNSLDTDAIVTGKAPGSVCFVFARVRATDTVNASVPKYIKIRIPNNDTTLKSLSVSDGVISPAFDPAVTEYIAVVPYGNSLPAAAAEASDENASVTVADAAGFEAGTNTAAITVTAENGLDTRVYTVSFVQQERTQMPVITTDNAAALSRMGTVEISGAGTIYYTVDGTEPNAYSSVYDGGIDISSLGLSAAAGSVTIKAAAMEDGRALSETAEKTFTLADTDAKLASLEINGTALEGFTPYVRTYTYTVTYEQWAADKSKTYTVTASASKDTSTVNVSETALALDCPDPNAAAEKAVIVEVTAESGEKTAYTVKFKVTPCTHVNTRSEIVYEPTCTELGEQQTVCTDCGTVLLKEETAALGHEFDEGTVTKDPSCAEEGVRTFRCLKCGYEHTAAIPALGHIWSEEWTDDIPADCTADGEKSHHCTVCDARNDITLIPALGHEWSGWTKTDDSTYQRTCAVCDVAETQAVTDNSHEHIFNGTAEVTAEATCQNEGRRTVQCSVEGCTETVTESTPRLPHTEGEPADVQQTCTEAGSSTVNCTVCGAKLSETFVPALGHSFTQYSDTATCTASGMKTAVCDNGCGAETAVPTPAKGHTYGEWLGDETGHKRVCAVCGAASDTAVHIENNGTVTVPATETSEGIRTYSCTVCGFAVRTETIEKLPPEHTHKFRSDWYSDSAAHWRQCECGETADYDMHTRNSGVETTENGRKKITFSCKVCGRLMDVKYAETETEVPQESAEPISSDVVSQLSAAGDGGKVTIKMDNVSELSETAISAVKDKDVDLVLDMGAGISWTINGQDVTEPQTVDMKVARAPRRTLSKALENVESERKPIQLDLEHKGDFGFSAQMTVTLSSGYNDYFAALYYYNPKTKELEYCSDCVVKNGKATFEMTHASQYAIVFTNEPPFEDVSAAAAAAEPVDAGIPVTNGVALPAAVLPGKLRLSGKKRRYRIKNRRKLDDMVFVL